MGGGGNQKWTGNWEPVKPSKPNIKISEGKIEGYDIEGIPSFPSPKSSRRNQPLKRSRTRKKPKKESKIDKELDFLSTPKKTKPIPPPLNQIRKMKKGPKK